MNRRYIFATATQIKTSVLILAGLALGSNALGQIPHSAMKPSSYAALSRGHAKGNGRWANAGNEFWSGPGAGPRSVRHSANVILVPFGLAPWSGPFPVTEFPWFGADFGPIPPGYPPGYGYGYGFGQPSLAFPGDELAYSRLTDRDYGNPGSSDTPNQSLTIPVDTPYTLSSDAARHYYPIINTKASARNAQRRAEEAFRAGNYHLAASLARQVVTLDADNGLALLFSSQASFAIGRYDAAAEDLKAAVELLPPDQWNYIGKNFRQFYGQNDYVRQMNRLERFLNDRPVYAPARLIRGHQWASLGYHEIAREDFAMVLAYRHNEATAKRLLEQLELQEFGGGSSDQSDMPVPNTRQLSPVQLKSGNRQPLPSPRSTLQTEDLPAPDDLDAFKQLDELELPNNR
jgi:hypothetical protein